MSQAEVQPGSIRSRVSVMEAVRRDRAGWHESTKVQGEGRQVQR